MGTHYKGKPAEVRALDTFVKLARAGNAVDRRLENSLDRFGFRENQFGVLEMLLHLGPLYQHQIGGKLLTSQPLVV